ncbi:MAG: hypothetical protein E7036_04970 [Opitutales bacterium]|nr:hypothetical protein [Opitutales bacterium]
MKKLIFILSAISTLLSISCTQDQKNISAFIYSSKDHRMPLHGMGKPTPMQIAYKVGDKWETTNIGLLFSFFGLREIRHVRQMTTPYLFKGIDGNWHCVWAFGKGLSEFAHSYSENFTLWRKQNNTTLPNGITFLNPIVKIDGKKYVVKFKSGKDFYQIETPDLITYSAPKKITEAQYANEYTNLKINGKTFEGIFTEIPQSCLDAYLAKEKDANRRNALEKIKPDNIESHLNGVKKLSATLSLTGTSKKINPKMFGLFYEDVGMTCDGVLYPECIQNRDFEFLPTDREGYTSTTAWEFPNTKYQVKTDNPISKNNPHYIQLDTTTPATIRNTGWAEGIYLKKGGKYRFSFFAKSKTPTEISAKVFNNKKIALTGSVKIEGDAWKKYSVELTASDEIENAKFELNVNGGKQVCLDMISLFPKDTYKGRENGLRKDIVELFAQLKPNFLRFPGGCIVHADKVANFYRWQNTIGKLEDRKPTKVVWEYHQTFGLGYQEYFELSEDIGAEPIPVVSAGVACQVRGGECVPMEDMPTYIQEVLDLIEWANGNAKTTKWGKVRAENGHPAPFNMKYLGIGNEDEMTKDFEKRYLMIKDAVNKKYPEIIIIGSSGIMAKGQDYDEGHQIVKKSKTPIIDEHYYCSPEWYIANQDFYDNHDRNGPKVYLGEFAPQYKSNKKRKSSTYVYNMLNVRENNVYSSLSSAIYMMNLERNGDIVSMLSYAPLVCRNCYERQTFMILADNKGAYPTTEYYMQKLFSHNGGEKYFDSKLKLDTKIFGMAERTFASIISDKNGDTIVKLINILPVPLEISADISSKIDGEKTVKKTVFTGKEYTDTKPTITESQTKLGGKFKETLQPYSFVILRFLK